MIARRQEVLKEAELAERVEVQRLSLDLSLYIVQVLLDLLLLDQDIIDTIAVILIRLRTLIVISHAGDRNRSKVRMS